MCVDGLPEVLQLVRGGWLEKVSRETYEAAPRGRRVIVYRNGQRHYALFHLGGPPEQADAEEEAFARMMRGDPPPGGPL